MSFPSYRRQVALPPTQSGPLMREEDPDHEDEYRPVHTAELAPIHAPQPPAALDFTQQQIQTIKDTVAKDATDSELAMFLHYCRRTGLDPIARQVYFIARGKDDKRTVSIQTGIDGFLLSAERSGQYLGHDPYEWCGPDGVWKQIWIEDAYPAAARVTVYREGRRPLTAVATFQEYVQLTYDYDSKSFVPNAMWKKMAARMLGKCALALALRELFPRELSGVYSEDEMGQADNPTGISNNGAAATPPALAEPTGARQSNGTPPARNGTSKSNQNGTPPNGTRNPATEPPASNGQGNGAAQGLDKNECRRRCFAVYIEAGGDTQDDPKMRADLGRILGKTVNSRADLTAEEWARCANHIETQLRGGTPEPPAAAPTQTTLSGT